MADLVGQQFGNYRLVRLLGEGAFGQVYLAEHIHLGTLAAIKIMHRSLTENGLEQFRNEARMLARLKHPNIMRTLEFGVEDGIAYLVMPYAEKGTLRDLYLMGQQQTPQTILTHVLQTAGALQHAHHRGYIHRDVKPGNLMVGEDDEVLLGDFGIALLVKEMRGEEVEGFVGTPAYAAPELFNNKPCQASDQYALGVTIYQWLTGELPFSGDLWAIAARRMIEPLPPPLRAKVPSLSAEVEAVVMKTLARNPDDRFPNMRTFAQAFEQACNPQPGVRRPPAATTVPDTKRQMGNYRLLRLLGEGAFAEVHLGEHVELGSQAAVKVMKTSLPGTEVEDFRREATILSDLQHPNIVRFFDYGIEDGIPYLVVGYAPNGTLRKRHPQGERVSPQDVLGYLKPIADALEYIHSQKLIHRDIKPENLLIGPKREIWLTDFGMTTIAHSSRSQKPEDLAGTFAYTAPEQIDGRPKRASDQYALGIVVYEWLTGERPFQGTYMEIIGQQVAKTPPSLCEKVPDIPPLVERVVLTALEKDPAKRFGSVKAFATALEQACRP
jgi:serine/threonine protein kinase